MFRDHLLTKFKFIFLVYEFYRPIFLENSEDMIGKNSMNKIFLQLWPAIILMVLIISISSATTLEKTVEQKRQNVGKTCDDTSVCACVKGCTEDFDIGAHHSYDPTSFNHLRLCIRACCK